MPLTTIRIAPALDTFTPLTEHQSQTPATFFGAKPVLHYHISEGRALVSPDQASELPIFTSTSSSESGHQDAAAAQEPVVETVEIFVSSENLTIFNTTLATGVSIPYPTISLHAIQRLQSPTPPSEEIQGLYMQLDLPSEIHSEDDELSTIELTLLAPSSSTATDTITALYSAISACSNLHPDPISQPSSPSSPSDDRIIFEGDIDSEEISGLPGVSRGVTDGSLPPPFPGSGGWITAENVGEYFDEDGNWIFERGGNDSVHVNGNGTDDGDEHEDKRVRRD